MNYLVLKKKNLQFCKNNLKLKWVKSSLFYYEFHF